MIVNAIGTLFPLHAAL